ncbi:MAG: hypothetical protein LIP09_08055 [Bacteroidales bacterium]|nr:hypothetical protein [Bacteroidales bacterium]
MNIDEIQEDAPQWAKDLVSQMEKHNALLQKQLDLQRESREADENRRAEADARAKEIEYARQWAMQFPDDTTNCNRQHYGNNAIDRKEMGLEFDPAEAQKMAQEWASNLPNK